MEEETNQPKDLTAEKEELRKCVEPWKTYRETLGTQKIDIEKQVDQTVFTISSGTIGLSLAILDKISPSPQFNWLFWILGLGWLLLSTSLILQAVSMWKAAKKISTTIENVEELVQATSPNEFYSKQEVFYDTFQNANNTIDRINFASLLCMLLGILATLVFAFSSVLVRESKDDEVKKYELTIKDSLNNKIIIMSNDKHRDKPSGKDSSSEKAKNFSREINKGREGKLNENKQAQQIATPPIKTKPKDK